MKKKFCLIFIVIMSFYSKAQDSASINKIIDSLNLALKNAKEDTARVNILAQLSYNTEDMDEGYKFAQQVLFLSQKIKFLKGVAQGRTLIGNYYWNISNYPQALEYYLQSLKICEQLNYKRGIASNLGNIGNVYLSLGNFRKALDYSFAASTEDNELAIVGGLSFDFTTIAKAYSQLNMSDSALLFGQRALDSALVSKDYFLIDFSLQALGDVFSKKNDIPKALEYYRKALNYSKAIQDGLGTSGVMQSIAELCKKSNQTDSSIYYAKQALKLAQSAKALPVVIQAATLLHNLYKPTDEHQSLNYLEIASAAKESLFNNQKNNELENIAYNEESRQKDKEAAKLEYRNNLKFYALSAILAAIGIIALIQLRNNKQKKKSNLLLKKQKEKVESTLSELKTTQAQLIQSEKMASLGELTAGIAHEIQNPLNFVNNFSEVNKELIDEMQQKMDNGNLADAKEIANDIKENSEKIHHHGKRAGDIVKGMLQHSRSSTGVKEPTDINALADEYLRLSYHGLRAKDKSFNATMKTDFDESIGKINIIPQDIGRVLLNLYNNAFYACTERSRSTVNQQISKNPISYEPTVTVTTKKSDNHVLITVSDNGNGIPQKIVDKIFQPFFTTKPTGQGTGLGLSLSYDIVKAHGGEIKVETEEGNRSKFIIQIPVKNI